MLVIAFGLITIVASGGGGDGDGGWLDDAYPMWLPTDVVVTDIDDDGDNDILTLAMLSTSDTHDEGHIYVYRQTSQGNFSQPDDYIVGQYPWQLVVGDINNDELPDLLATDVGFDCAWLMLQNSNIVGQFLSAQKINTGRGPYYAAIDDLNNDDKSEIAISDNSKNSYRMAMYYNDAVNQDVLLPAEDFILPGSSSNIATGDLNGDSLTDLLIWTYLEPSGYTPNGVLSISFQQPDGTLGPVSTLAPQKGYNVGYISIDDYNGDDANDIFVLFTPSSSDYKAKLTVLLQNSQPGTFAEPVDTSLSGVGFLDDAVVADLNGDDRPDLAFTEFNESRLKLFKQDGSGSFSLEEVYDLPIDVGNIAAGDIDGDGLNDIAVLGGENECYTLIQSHSNKGTFNSPELLQ